MQINPRQFHSNFVVPQYRLGTGKPVVADSAMAVALCAIRCQANWCLRLQVGQQPGRPDADALLAEEVRRGRLTSPALKNAGAPPSPPPVAPLFMPHRVKRIDRVTADSSPPAAPSDGRNTDVSVPPAQAGEPPRPRRSGTSRRAYPRAGGGTQVVIATIRWAVGLSPAGGGTALPSRAHATDHGLSPRRRGNREERRVVIAEFGPIPAQAGEPASRPNRRSPRRAYPRAGGGTA